MHHLPRLLTLLVAVFSAASLGWAQQQTYPNRFITLVVPYPPGGPTGDTAHVLAKGLSARLGQPLVVENVGGAGGNLGVTRVVRAAPDGYTLLVHNMALASSVTLYPHLALDPEKDLAGISLLNTSPLVLIGRRTLDAKTLPELLAWMRSAPSIKFVNAGTGNVAHLCGALFAQAVGVGVDMIAYRGGGPALTDTIGGHVDLYCSTAQLVIEPIKAGIVKGYAVTSRERYAPLAELPTMVESGLPKLDIQYWHGLWAPAATPKPILDKLNDAVRQVLADPETIGSWAKTGILVYPEEGRNPQATASLLHAEIGRWGQVIRENKIEGLQ
jgi:tripartite-type tricarboxylate transporter receptor subunit TctC